MNDLSKSEEPEHFGDDAVPVLVNSEGHAVELRGIFRGRPAFLLSGGPSLIRNDLSLLNTRGILTCAINNAATIFRPHLWVGVDSPGNFADAIWRDPAILKFTRASLFGERIVARDSGDNLVVSDQRVAGMPAVFGFRVNERFCPETWLEENTFNFGSARHLSDSDDNPGGRSVMYVALRLMYYLGVRNLFLLGCDFRMRLAGNNYAFDQHRNRGSVISNNNLYRVFNHRMRRLLPFFEAAGFRVINCTEGSRLTVFPYLPLQQALDEVMAECPQQPSTAGMYDRAQRERNANS